MNPQEQAVVRSWAALTDTAREAMHRSHAYRALADALDGLTDRGTGDLVAITWRSCPTIAQAALHATHGNLGADLDTLTTVTT